MAAALLVTDIIHRICCRLLLFFHFLCYVSVLFKVIPFSCCKLLCASDEETDTTTSARPVRLISSLHHLVLVHFVAQATASLRHLRDSKI